MARTTITQNRQLQHENDPWRNPRRIGWCGKTKLGRARLRPSPDSPAGPIRGLRGSVALPRWPANNLGSRLAREGARWARPARRLAGGSRRTNHQNAGCRCHAGADKPKQKRRLALAGSRKGKLPLPTALCSGPTQFDPSAVFGEIRSPKSETQLTKPRRARGLSAGLWLRKTPYLDSKLINRSRRPNASGCYAVRPFHDKRLSGRAGAPEAEGGRPCIAPAQAPPAAGTDGLTRHRRLAGVIGSERNIAYPVPCQIDCCASPKRAPERGLRPATAN